MLMKLGLSLIMAASLTLVGGVAHADPVTTTHQTSDYVESRVDGDSVVKFTGDELAAPPGGAYGDTIRRPPGITKVGLIRPRLNFVVEMLKSVENL